jgi:hypothetical protein
VVEAVVGHLRSLDGSGELFLEPVSVGLFVKRSGATVLQLRPMTKWVALMVVLPRLVRDPRISRKPMVAGRKVWHVVNLRAAADVDDIVRGWITEAWETAA